MKVVLANGCFDPLHYGHVQHLRAARRMGTRLVVALTSDEAVAHEKGPSRPYAPWEERAEVLRELRCVSEVVRSESGIDAIMKVRPDVFVKGIDYSLGGLDDPIVRFCLSHNIRIAFTETPKQSSTELIRRYTEASHAPS
jgi:rfaE bifunctional protein nucleotidyltransferase chain/domain